MRQVASLILRIVVSLVSLIRSLIVSRVLRIVVSRVLWLIVSLIRSLVVGQVLRDLLRRKPNHLQQAHLQQTHLPAHLLGGFRLYLLLLSSSTNKPRSECRGCYAPVLGYAKAATPQYEVTQLGCAGARDLAVVRYPVQPLLVDNFVSAGATANNVWFLFRFEMPHVSSLSRSARLPSGQVLLLEPEPHRLTLTASRKIGHTNRA